MSVSTVGGGESYACRAVVSFQLEILFCSVSFPRQVIGTTNQDSAYDIPAEMQMSLIWETEWSKKVLQ